MPKSNRSITPKASSKSSRHPAKAEPKPITPPAPKAQKNGHKNGHGQPPVKKASSHTFHEGEDKEAKDKVQAVWTGQPERQERLRDLVKLAKDQGYLTWDDLNEAIPDSVNNPEELEAIIMFLRNLEIDVIDASEVDRYKATATNTEEELSEEEKTDAKLDILDDPVRMYLKQMGQVPLLTREQEVEISKRIEDAEAMVQRHLNRFGFTAREYLNLARKLEQGRERFDRVIQDKKIDSRDKYLSTLKALVRSVESANQKADQCYTKVVKAGTHKATLARSEKDFASDAALQKLFVVLLLQAEGDRGIRRLRAQPPRAGRFGAAAREAQTREQPQQGNGAAIKELEQKLTGRRSSSWCACRCPAFTRTTPSSWNALRARRTEPRWSRPNLRLVISIAKKYTNRGLSFLDLIQGGQHGPDEGGGKIRVSPRLQVLHLRDVVDPPGDHPQHRRPGAHHPHPGAHDRDDQQADARAEAARAGVRARADAGGSVAEEICLPVGARPRGPAHGASSRSRFRRRWATATTRPSAISSRTSRRRTRRR